MAFERRHAAAERLSTQEVIRLRLDDVPEANQFSVGGNLRELIVEIGGAQVDPSDDTAMNW
jgi:hypothetical protein